MFIFVAVKGYEVAHNCLAFNALLGLWVQVPEGEQKEQAFLHAP